MTLLELIRTMCAQLGVVEPNSVIGNNDRTVSQMRALLTTLGSDIVVQHDWRQLRKEAILITRAMTVRATLTQGSSTVTLADASALSDNYVASGEGIPQYARVTSKTSNTVTLDQPCTKTGEFDVTFSQARFRLPTDWARQVPLTEWNRSTQWPIKGPITPQAWQQFKSGITYRGPWEVFRLVGNHMIVMPPPPSGLTFAFDYISKNWVVEEGGQTKAIPTQDTDTFIFSDSMLMTGLKARWFDVHGMDSTVEKADFAGLLNTAKGQDSSADALTISPGSRCYPCLTVPDGNWMV